MSNVILAFIVTVCGIAFALLMCGEDAALNESTRRTRHTAGWVVLLLLLTGPRWLPALGIEPQAALNGTFAVAFGMVILMQLGGRIGPSALT